MAYFQILVTVTLFILLYLPIMPQLVGEWAASGDYSHGFLIPLISLYFIWQKRVEFRKIPISPSATGALVIAAGLALYIVARIGYQDFLQYISMLVVLFGMVYAHGGPQIARTAAFSISYLIFMIPLPQLVYTTVTFHLRLLSTQTAFFVIKLLGLSATRAGNIINLPTCALVVANPCSGLRGLMVFIAASLAIGYLFQKTVLRRVALTFMAIVLAILMNTVRLVATACIAYAMKFEEVPASVHDTTGLICTIAGLVILFWLNNILSRAK